VNAAGTSITDGGKGTSAAGMKTVTGTATAIASIVIMTTTVIMTATTTEIFDL